MKQATCPKKTSLLETYQKMTTAYCDAVANLRESALAADEVELRRLTQTLGLEAARAREDLLDHDAVHEC
jgi:hypothetical protein